MREIHPVILTHGDRDPSRLAAQADSQFGRCAVFRDPGHGAAWGTRHAIAAAFSSAPSTEQFVLFLEDDVLLHDSFANTASTIDIPATVGVVSFCDMREMQTGARDGLYVRHALGVDQRGWWGNQAMLIHHDTARILVEQDWDQPMVSQFPAVLAHAVNWGDGAANCSDIRMSLLVHRYGGQRNKYAVHVPSLALHQGFVSGCFPERLPELGERETKNWIGARQ